MAEFWELAKLVVILGTILIGLVLILLSIPNSRLPQVFSKLFFAIAVLLGLYIISPIDFIPDFIPLLGQLDDAAASIAAASNAVAGLVLYFNSRSSTVELKDEYKYGLSRKP